MKTQRDEHRHTMQQPRRRSESPAHKLNTKNKEASHGA
jgi:hypothetical protein